jgi:NaMN:DMB phosphoribosyltransferase
MNSFSFFFPTQLEIAAMMGACIAVARSSSSPQFQHQPVPALLIDGFISTVSFLMALKCFPEDVPALKRCSFLSHTSAERGMQIAVREVEKAMGVKEGERRPLLDLGMRLGEG